MEAEKGNSSDSFKRAAVKWGIGRFLYRMKIHKIPANEKKSSGNYPYPVDNRGQRIWDITEYINNLNSGNKSANQKPLATNAFGKAKTKAELSKLKADLIEKHPQQKKDIELAANKAYIDLAKKTADDMFRACKTRESVNKADEELRNEFGSKFLDRTDWYEYMYNEYFEDLHK